MNLFHLKLFFAFIIAISTQILPESLAEFGPDEVSGLGSFSGAGSLAGANTSDINRCKRSGDRYVHNYIQYECFTSNNQPLNNEDIILVGKPIGCVPTNKTSGPVILPGATYTTLHFRYECNRDKSNTVNLRITHCVDNSGQLIKIGDFFSETKTNISSKQQESLTTTTATVECVGDAFLAKKIVHKWSKCKLKSGETLIEGNFVTEDVNQNLSNLQKSEIISCVRDGSQVSLKCTGCVTSAGVHIAVAKYLKVEGDTWIQCRRLKDGCKLINVSSDYVDCDYEGRKFPHDSSFKSESGLSSFYCSHGVVTKKGCLINGNLVLVGDVRYIDNQPLLCEQADQLAQFNGIIGCDLPNGKFKRFLEVWRDDKVMKRCSWESSVDGITKSQVTSFACVDGKEIIPLNKVVQRQNGDYFKCAPVISSSELPSSHQSLRDDLVNGDIELKMRAVSAEELAEFLKRKNAKLDLVEYFGVGARSNPNEFSKPIVLERPGIPSGLCTDMLPFCTRLIGYCNSVENSDFLEPGLTIDSNSEARKLQSSSETASATQRPPPVGCEDDLTPFQKLQTLVQISCAKSCGKCSFSKENQAERLISNLEKSSHCGR